MQLYNDPSTNVALPLFEPAEEFTYVGFDKNEHMFIRTYLDDTVNPPTSKKQTLYRWYMCESYYTGCELFAYRSILRHSWLGIDPNLKHD